MQRIFGTLLFWTLFLSACSTGVASPTVDLPNPESVLAADTPTVDQPPAGEIASAVPTFEGCAYQWAYKDMPELSSSFQRSIQVVQAGAQAYTYAFGEDCIHDDGRVDFLAKETDFNITLPVDDLADESGLGEWIVKVMQIIEQIPPEQIVGPQSGMVTIIFQSGGDQKVLNFYIDAFRGLSSGSSNSEIYRALQIPQQDRTPDQETFTFEVTVSFLILDKPNHSLYTSFSIY